MLYQTENQHGGDVYGGGITLDFSANTNPLGTPPGVLEAVCRGLPRLHRYPDPYCRRLVQAIAAHEQVPASYILLWKRMRKMHLKNFLSHQEEEMT